MQTSEQIDKISAALGGEWREHPKAAGYYVSDGGKVSRVVWGRVRELRGSTAGAGYRAITWNDSGVWRKFYIHRAVCELFHGPAPSSDMDCRHLNGKPSDNRAANLAWGTKRQNQLDRRAHGTAPIGAANPRAKLNDGSVQAMRSIREDTGASYAQIARQFGVSPMTAFRAITRESWQ